MEARKSSLYADGDHAVPGTHCWEDGGGVGECFCDTGDEASADNSKDKLGSRSGNDSNGFYPPKTDVRIPARVVDGEVIVKQAN
ncbi:hypothetical protein GN958_ATG21636 [Phytophthora infestans]|uniref:Uncharacterized protein n=1 Tax=Phytophthora infestans TaxID=4787 RepID=A0A8S9TMG4_PHYIN|nr:hypothetical protein GN958_ATG21636 [Phytophthora infestans]